MKTFSFQLLSVIILISTNFLSYGQTEFKDMINRYLSRYYQSASDMKVYVHTDKYLYEQGENLWLTAIATDRFTHEPLANGENLTFKLFNNRGTEVWDKKISIENGIAREVIPLLGYFSEGEYTLKAFKAQQELYQRNFMIKEHVIPYHLVNVSFQDKYYEGGERITVHFSATDYFKNPARASYEYVLVNGNKIIRADKGKIDKTGSSSVSFSLPNPVSEDGLYFNLTVQEKNVTESVRARIPTQSEKIDVRFFPEGGSLIHGLENKMTVKAYGPNGEDFRFSGVVFNEKNEKLGKVESDVKGVGIFTFLPEKDQKLKFQVTSPYTVNRIFEVPDPLAEGAAISMIRLKNSQIELQIGQVPETERTYYLGISNKGEMYHVEKFSLKDRKSFDFSTLRPGINKVTLFNQMMVPTSEIMAYVPEIQGNNVSAAFTSDIYKNREKVILNVDSDNNLYYAFSAVDKYRLLVPEKRPNILSHFAVGSEISGNPVINHEVFNQPENLSLEVNNLLAYSTPTDSWTDIYALHNKKIDFQRNAKHQQSQQAKGEKLNYHLDGGQIVYSNFSHDIYYLANNPVLIEKLNEQKKTIKQEPFYKQQLRNGISLREVIHNMKPYTVMDGKIVFPGTMNSLNFQGGALIVLDGIKLGENIGLLDQINPFDIDEIFISTNANDILNYTGLNSVGIIDIKTKRGESPTDKNATRFDEEFQSPDYSTDKGTKTDLRTTIFYSPFRSQKSSPESITFYHSDIRTDVIGKIEGLDEHGNPFYQEVEYSSFNYSEENQ